MRRRGRGVGPAVQAAVNAVAGQQPPAGQPPPGVPPQAGQQTQQQGSGSSQVAVTKKDEYDIDTTHSIEKEGVVLITGVVTKNSKPLQAARGRGVVIAVHRTGGAKNPMEALKGIFIDQHHVQTDSDGMFTVRITIKTSKAVIVFRVAFSKLDTNSHPIEVSGPRLKVKESSGSLKERLTSFWKTWDKARKYYSGKDR